MMDAFVNWELSVLHAVQDGATAAQDMFWSVVTYFGESGIFWIVLSLILMFPKKTRRAGFTMGLALLIGLVLGNGLMKNLFARPRPYDLDPTLSCRLVWGEMSNDYSFPSGHTLASFEAATGLFLYHKKWGAAALILAFFVMISRLFLVVHYPSDLVAGALFGVLFAALASFCVKSLWALYDRKLAKK